MKTSDKKIFIVIFLFYVLLVLFSFSSFA